MDEESAAERYLRHRNAFRTQTSKEFLSRRPLAGPIIGTSSELVASLTYFSADKDIRSVRHGHYICDLLVSFCRSHFIAAEHVVQGELVEAATILRKQMELVCRLKELRSGIQIEKLIAKTPQARHLGPKLRRLYGEYSAVAHSSVPQKLQLLGTVEKDRVTFTPLYPLFDENMRVSLNHLVLLTFEFALWTMEFFRQDMSPYDGEHDRSLFKTLAKLAIAEFSEGWNAGLTAGMPQNES